MRFSLIIVISSLIASTLQAQTPCGPGPVRFASQVVAFNPGPGIMPGVGFGITSRILCAPQGSADVLSLGVNGTVTLGFDSPLVDGPGTDFVVFENGFLFGGVAFAELAFVEVSSDGVNFARFPSRYLGAPAPVGAFGGIIPGSCKNLAGANVVFLPPSVSLFADPCVVGGDAFDLDEVAGDPLVMSGLVDPNQIHFVRLVDIEGGGSFADSVGSPIYDPYGGPGTTSSADFDGVAVVHDVAGFDAAAPRVTVRFDEPTRRLVVTVGDSDGLFDIAGITCSAFSQVPFDFAIVLPFFEVFAVSTDEITIVSQPIAAGTLGTLTLTVADLAGRIGSDSDLVH